MRTVLQRAKNAQVEIDGKVNGKIDHGLVLLVGFEEGDGQEEIDYTVRKIVNCRIFSDENGKMNLSIGSVGGSILSISQFTLFADVHKGNRPSFIKAGKPEHADLMWIKFNEALRSGGVPVKEGRFGAHMRVGLVNDGPVTIVIDTETDMPDGSR